MKYWVNSPHINEKNVNEWFGYCRRNKVAIMGWPYEQRLGKKFKDEIEIGDFILVAQGSNRNKRLCLVGLVLGEAETNAPETPPAQGLHFFRRLDPALILSDDPANYGLSFSCAAWGNSDRAPALYQLYPDRNVADRIIIEILIKLLPV